MMRRELADGLDADTRRRLVRSFLLVRIVRGTVLLLFLAVALVGVEANDWPDGIAVAIVLAMLVQAATLGVWCRSARRG